nr:MAG TPA: hypothetical protein [Caudoviricetes sp.]
MRRGLITHLEFGQINYNKEKGKKHVKKNNG